MNRRDFLKQSISLAIVGSSSGLIGQYGIKNSYAAPLTVDLANPSIQPLFTESVTNALSKRFTFKKKRRHNRKLKHDNVYHHRRSRNHPFNENGWNNKHSKTHKQKTSRYKIKIAQTTQETGLVDEQGNRLSTTIWGYGTRAQKATWPGRTFEAKSNEKVKIEWVNRLQHHGRSLPHLLPVDESLHWCYGIQGYENVNIANDGVPTVTHVHGAHVESDSDGNPEYFFGLTEQSKGPRWVKQEYSYDNSQTAGTLWYHDHALGITRLNVYAGLAGFYIIRDKLDTGKRNNPLRLPAKRYEHGYVVQDRMFKKNGDLFFPAFPGDPSYDDFITGEGATPPEGQASALAEFFGDHILVNGKLWPRKDVEPRNYRLRMLNACDSRFMRLRFRAVPIGETDFTNASAPLPFHLIGSDQGLLASPVQVTEIDFMPAERLDIVFDFSSVNKGTRVIIENILGDAPFSGDLPDPNPTVGDVFVDRQTDRVMAFDVVKRRSHIADNFNPTLLNSNYTSNQEPVDKTRKLGLYEGTDEFGRLQPLLGTAEPVVDAAGNIVSGTIPWGNPSTENPKIGDTEIWEIYNTTGDAHPIHVHLVHFDILDRVPFTADVIPQTFTQSNGATGNGFRMENIAIDSNNVAPALATEEAPKDMVLAYPGQVTRIKMTFDKPGRYIWHCHILSHEDHEMMRPIEVSPLRSL